MFDKFEQSLINLINQIKKLKKALVFFGNVFFWFFLAGVVVGIIVFIDFIGNESLDFVFMKPLYSFVKSLLFETDWILIYKWILRFIFNILWIVYWIIILLVLFELFLEYKKVISLSNPTKIRFLKLVRNFLIFIVFFITLYDFLVDDISTRGLSVFFGFLALAVTLVEDWIHKKRAPYIEALENEATRVIQLSEYFEIDNTYHDDFESSDIRAKVVTKSAGLNTEYAIEYFTNYPTRSKILLVPIIELKKTEIMYFCKILNNMKLEFDPIKFKELKTRIFVNDELYKFANHINYDYLSGVERKRYFIQDVYYDIKHYYELKERNNKGIYTSKIEAVHIGVQTASKILQIKKPDIYFKKATDFSNRNISSYYNKAKNSIVFNADWAAQIDELEIIVTCFHETRHAYQYHCIKTNSIEDEETIKIWKREFEGYNKPSNTNDSKNDESYLKQAIEIDAIAFAYRQMKELFDVEVKIPEEIKPQVNERCLELKGM